MKKGHLAEQPSGKTYVVGHVNPDTDAIASAIGYAWLLRTRDGVEAIPARLGPINPQTSWVLDRLDLEPPELLYDASPRFSSVARRLDSVSPDQPLADAWVIANRTGTVAPVVESDGCPYGLISGISLFSYLSQLVGPRPDQQEARLAEIFDSPCKDAADTGVPAFQDSSRIRDALPKILREERTDFWVVDEENQYVGVCRQADILNPPRLKLVLVDHNEVSQSIGSLDEADLLEVLDHHRLGNAPTRMPIQFRVEPVGSTSTLVSEEVEESGLSAPPDIAGLLLAGLLSDTLMLSSPTTTERDHSASKRLSRWAFVGNGPLSGEDANSFGRQLLQAGAGLSTRDPESIVTGDLKIYKAGEWQFGVAQAEITDMHELSDHLEPLWEALLDLQESRGLDFSALMVTDIVDGSSRIMIQDAPAVLDDLPYPKLQDGTLQAEGVVSRKKQLIPVMLALLER